MQKPFLTLCALLCLSAPAKALEEVEYSTEHFTQEFVLSNVPDFVTTPEGGTDWKLFGTTRTIEFQEKDADGMDLAGVKPEFTPLLKALNNTEITMQGYMFPLDPSEKQTRFLFGPFPASCPFHYHAGPSLIIEVHAKSPVPFTYDAFNIKGRLELIDLDLENNLFYRLHDAQMVK